MIHEHKNQFIVRYYDSSYIKTRFTISYKNNVIDALEDRDIFIKEWYGEETYSKIVRFDQFSSIGVKRLITHGYNCFYDGKGVIYDSSLEVFPKTTETKQVQIKPGVKAHLSWKDISRITSGEAAYTAHLKKYIALSECGLRLDTYDKFGGSSYKKNKRENVDETNRFLPLEGYHLIRHSCTGKYESSFPFRNKVHRFGHHDTRELAQSISFEKYKEITGNYYKKDPRFTLDIDKHFIGITKNTKGAGYYSSGSFFCYGVNHRLHVGLFIEEIDAKMAAFDMHFIINGELHEYDPRRTK
jgi:hypothetical protein